MHSDGGCFSESRVLIIEDEALIAEELKARVSDLGFSVIAAVASADAGVEIAIRERPNLVLMDIRLKGKKDGIEAASEIRQCCDVPLVYISAHSDRSTVERVKKTDHDGFILKPFHGRELRSTIDLAMRRHAIRTQTRWSGC